MATRMSKERREAAEAAQVARLEAEAAKGSTAEVHAYSAKKAETDIRDACLDGGIRTEEDWRARAAGAADLYLTIGGVRYLAEVKTGGTLGSPNADGSWTEANILPKAQLVVFPIIDMIRSKRELYGMSVIVSRERFIEMLEACSRKGLKGTCHVTSPGAKGRTPVIAFQPTPLAKLRRLMEDLLYSEGATIQEYIDGELTEVPD